MSHYQLVVTGELCFPVFVMENIHLKTLAQKTFDPLQTCAVRIEEAGLSSTLPVTDRVGQENYQCLSTRIASLRAYAQERSWDWRAFPCSLSWAPVVIESSLPVIEHAKIKVLSPAANGYRRPVHPCWRTASAPGRDCRRQSHKQAHPW